MRKAQLFMSGTLAWGTKSGANRNAESWEWGLTGPHIGKAAKAGWTLAETSERVLEFHGVSRGSDTGTLCERKPDL